ncbi:MAG: translocation/assembly module TamB domain-containing protein, partial [Acidobacteriota bacterium]
AAYVGSTQGDTALLGLASGGAAAAIGSSTSAAEAESATPFLLDIRVQSPRIAFINTKTARILGTADLQVGGTYDRPIITGRVELDSGEVSFSGNRFFVTQGFIDFVSGNATEPVFDIDATTRPRVGSQTYNVDLHLSGTFDKLTMNVTSDPYLPQVETLSLLLGATSDLQTAEQRALRSPQESQARLIQSAAAQLIASPISSTVGSVVEKTLPGAIDTVQITPIFSNEFALQQLNPSARVTVGKRISNRVYLTYSRQFNTSDELLLLEYDQSDRLSWVLSRNEDRTFALDFRIRFVF